MSRNPYHVDGEEPTLRRSVFACMDILGYSEAIRASEAAGTQQTELRELHKAVMSGRRWLEDKDDPPQLREFIKKDLYALKAFTDNIVIGWPVRGDAEVEFGSAFFKLGAFQFQMAISGYFMRGGLAVGDAYIDDIAVFGGALIEAYDGEAKSARDPRIILTPSAIAAANQHPTYYTDKRHAPHVRELLKDADGQWFLNSDLLT